MNELVSFFLLFNCMQVLPLFTFCCICLALTTALKLPGVNEIIHKSFFSLCSHIFSFEDLTFSCRVFVSLLNWSCKFDCHRNWNNSK